MRGCLKALSVIVMLVVAVSAFGINVLAMDKRPTWPDGVLQAFYADEGSTRNDAWIDKTNRIIKIPAGTEFDDGKENHGVYHYYSDFKFEDVFYVHWVVKVHEAEDVDDMDVIFSQDPAYLSEYTGKGQGEKELGTTRGVIYPEEDISDVYYGDVPKEKWIVLSYGFEVPFEGTNHVQHRLHFKNKAPVDVKYLIVTTEKIQSLTCDPETGEIDGITNDKPYVEPTPSPTPEPTPTPTKTPEQTQNAQQTQPVSSPDSTPSNNDTKGGNNTALIIIIVAAVVVAGGVVVFLVVKNKKKS